MSSSPKPEDLEAPVLTELAQAVHEIAKELLGEAEVRERVRAILRARVQRLLATLEDDEAEPAGKKKGK
jgi:predicted O-methyltransferase YrrM